MRKGGKGMGLFSRKECDVCKKKLSLAEGLKCLDGSICSECKKKMSPLFTDYKNTPIEKIKEKSLTYLNACKNDISKEKRL